MAKINYLKVEKLEVSIQGKKVLQGVDLDIPEGKLAILMGPNGSGKSSLANTLMGHPCYLVNDGKIFFQNKDITNTAAEERAKMGLFLAFQHPVEIPGVSLANFLRVSYQEKFQEKISPINFRKKLGGAASELGIESSFLERSINEGFSGGEKKKAEILQMLILKPKMAILDETDSGLDVDALKIVANGIKKYLTSKVSAMLITHQTKILSYLKPDLVYIMIEGKIVKSGGRELVKQIEEEGYEK